MAKRRKLTPAQLKKRRAAVLRKTVRKLGKEGRRARSQKAAATRVRRHLAYFGDKENAPEERADLAFEAIDPNLGYLPDDFYDRVVTAARGQAIKLRFTVAMMDDDGNIAPKERIFVEIPAGASETDAKKVIWARFREYAKTAGESGGSDPGSALMVYAVSFAADY